MHSSSTTVTRQDPIPALREAHRLLLEEIQSIDSFVRNPSENVKLASRIQRFIGQLAEHFDQEEITLVPWISRFASQPWLQDAVHAEHNKLVSWLTELQEAFLSQESGQDNDIEDRWGNFFEAIRSHFSMEENVLFWYAEKNLFGRQS
jgi:hemerythrin-like domain-containing protein